MVLSFGSLRCTMVREFFEKCLIGNVTHLLKGDGPSGDGCDCSPGLDGI